MGWKSISWIFLTILNIQLFVTFLMMQHKFNYDHKNSYVLFSTKIQIFTWILVQKEIKWNLNSHFIIGLDKMKFYRQRVCAHMVQTTEYGIWKCLNRSPSISFFGLNSWFQITSILPNVYTYYPHGKP